MKTDTLDEVGINEAGGLYVRPSTEDFPFIYREAMEVGWNPQQRLLFGPKPREWSHLDWFKQIRDAAKEQGVTLRVTPSTIWRNIPASLQKQISEL